MSKEFSGGALPQGFSSVPLDFREDAASAVGITHFDYDGLDSLEARARDALDSGGSIEQLLEEVALNILKAGPPELVDRLARRICRIAGEQMIARLLAVIIDAENPKFRAWAIAHAIGSSVVGTESVPATARRFGRRKQALFQEIEHVQKELGVHIIRSNLRDAAAREKMRVSNYRHCG